MKLQTALPIRKESEHLINYNSKIVVLGSCFSKNMGNLFDFYKFQINQNPFGILFHPKAIENFISNAIKKKKYTESDLFHHNERWHCFDAHSSLSSSNKEVLLSNLNAAIISTNSTLKETSHIIITLGTAWVYRFVDTNEVVANCHKIPQKKFVKELLSVNEISKITASIVKLLKSVNPLITVIFTVSPVRHLKDGFAENTRSKAHLFAGIEKSIKNSVHYFASYEIMMDELRDYRFYAEDLIHPNKTAINYIWEKFLSAWFSEETKVLLQEIESIQKGLLHRAFNENSAQHQKFLKNLEKKKENISKKLPFIKF